MLTLIVTLVVLGLIWWLVERYIPMSEPFHTIVRVLIVLVIIIWLLSFIGWVDIPARWR